MSISGFPAFMEDMKVFLRERLNGYYSVASFVAANTISSVPFLAIISFTSALPVYWLSGLNKEAGRFFYFVFNLFMALFVTESMMMAMAPLVPHFLVGIAGGAGVLGLDMLVCGFFQPAGQLPRPVFYYPLHFLSFETYAFYGFVKNEFDGTHGWGCPCSAMAGGCPAALGGAACELEGTDILAYWDVPAWNKCTCPGVAAAPHSRSRCLLAASAYLTRTLFVSLPAGYVSIVVQAAFVIFFRLCFYGACKYSENKSPLQNDKAKRKLV